MGFDLNGKVALITGSSRGIGRNIAIKFAENGADVVINAAKTSDHAEELLKTIQNMGRKAIFEQADITVYKEAKAMVDSALEKMSKIDILVISGGVINRGKFITAPNFFREIDPEMYIDFFYSQYFSRMFCIRAVLDHMIEKKYGKIVSISTDAGRFPTPGESMPGGAGAALIQSTKVLASEFSRWGIRINTLATTVTKDTPGMDYIAQCGPAEKIFMRAMERQPFPISSDDIAEATLFLSSKESDQITGQTLSVNGGLCFPG